jgi:hypothetical protein
MSLRVKPSSATAARTRSEVPATTPGSSFKTRDTVFKLTPACEATSRIVGRPLMGGTAGVFDNVVIARDYGLATLRLSTRACVDPGVEDAA